MADPHVIQREDEPTPEPMLELDVLRASNEALLRDNALLVALAGRTRKTVALSIEGLQKREPALVTEAGLKVALADLDALLRQARG